MPSPEQSSRPTPHDMRHLRAVSQTDTPDSEGDSQLLGKYGEIQQKQYANGAIHLYGVDAETNKKRHLSHDEVLSYYGYADHPKQSAETVAHEAAPLRADTHSSHYAPVEIQTPDDEEIAIATIQTEHGLTYQEARDRYAALNTPGSEPRAEEGTQPSTPERDDEASNSPSLLSKMSPLYWAARMQTNRSMRRSAKQEKLSTMSTAERKKHDRKQRIIVGLGVTTVAAAITVVANRYGFDILPSIVDGDGIELTPWNNETAGSPESGTPVAEAMSDARADNEHQSRQDSITPAEVPSEVLSPEVVADFDIPTATGGEALMDRLGVDPSVWYQNQDEFLQNFPQEGYRMADGNVGLSRPGQMSEEAMKFWAEKANLWN